MKKKIINIISIFLIICSFAFIIQRIVSLDIDFSKLITPINIAMIVIMPFLTVTVIFSNSYCWRMVLSLFANDNIPVGDAFSVYAKANVMKYLPGNIGHYAGRQLLGGKFGLKQTQLAIASILEIIYSTIAMLVCAFGFCADMILQELQSRFSVKVYVELGVVALVLLLTIILIAFIYRKNKYIIALLKLIKSFRFWRVIILSALLFAFGSVIHMMEYVVLLGQYVSLDFHMMFLLLSANFFATFIGFVMPGVPGGIGVREAILLAILSPFFPGDVIILAAVMHRIIMIIGDVVTVPVSCLIVTNSKF